jgi:hypothetical protein
VFKGLKMNAAFVKLKGYRVADQEEKTSADVLKVLFIEPVEQKKTD